MFGRRKATIKKIKEFEECLVLIIFAKVIYI